MRTISDTRLTEAAVQGLQCKLQGSLLRPGQDGYDAARQTWNGMIDRKPALIVRCANASDVIQTIGFAQRNDLVLSIRGSGHNPAGFGVCDGGLMVDLSPMKRIWVDPVRQIARAQAGVTWGEFDKATQAVGLATTGARVSTTGIAGVTLGGGYGWLMRNHGLTIDNLRSVEVITADGRVVSANASENADLFWGVRGGGGNFGIVTSLEYQLHPLGPTVTGGAAFYPTTKAKHLLRFYRELMASAPDALSTQINFLIAPPAPFVPSSIRGVPVIAIAVCHSGPEEDAQRDLAPLRELGPPLLDRIGQMAYCKLQRLFDAAGSFGYHVHGRSGHLTDLNDDVIEILAAHAPTVTSPLSIVMISSLGGAVGRVGEYDTAFSHRNTAFDFAIDSVWENAARSERHMCWTDTFWRALHPFSTGVYVNELGNEGDERVREAYSAPTYDRLVALKEKYDPENFFHLNQNIMPSSR